MKPFSVFPLCTSVCVCVCVCLFVSCAGQTCVAYVVANVNDCELNEFSFQYRSKWMYNIFIIELFMFLFKLMYWIVWLICTLVVQPMLRCLDNRMTHTDHNSESPCRHPVPVQVGWVTNLTESPSSSLRTGMPGTPFGMRVFILWSGVWRIFPVSSVFIPQ